MKRTLLIDLPLFFSTSVEIIRCNAYRYSVETVAKFSLDAEGKASVALEVLAKNASDVYILKLSDDIKLVFWVYEGSEPIDLKEANNRELYASYNKDDKYDEMNLVNFNVLLNRYLAGEVIVSEEEKKLLCDYFSFADAGGSDDRLCEIDKGLIDA